MNNEEETIKIPKLGYSSEIRKGKVPIEWAKKNDPKAVPETVKAKDWAQICTLMATDDQIRSLANAPGQIKLVKIKIMEKLNFPLIYMEYLFAMNQPTFTEES